MTPKEYLQQIGFRDILIKMHSTIDDKHSLEGQIFDAWYTDQNWVLREFRNTAYKIASRIREDCLRGYTWDKGINQESDLWKTLEKYCQAPKYWEDSPEGTLTGLAIIFTGWVANQSCAKTRDNPNDKAMEFFDTIKNLINASMELGIELAEKEKN